MPLAFDEEETTTSATTTTTESSTSTATSSVKPIEAIAAATVAAVPHVDYSSEEPVIESIGQAAALSASHALIENSYPEEDASLDASTADKTDVHQQAEKLLIAGVKQTSHDEEAALRTNKLTLGRPTVRSSSTATLRTTPAMLTSTETVTEISSTQERIRGYRRFAQKRIGGSAATLRRHVQLPRGTKPTSSSSSNKSTTTTTLRSTTPTRSYQERLAASRLRLSRLSVSTKPTPAAAATSTTAAATSRPTTASSSTTISTRTTASALSPVRAGAELGPNRKLSVRNIDRETGQHRASWDSVQSNLQRFQVQRGNRVYTPATRASSRTTTASSTTSTTRRPSHSSTQSPQRGRNRHVVNYRTQAPQQQRTRGTTTPRSTTTTTHRTTAAALSTLSQQISAIASGYTYTPAPTNSLNTLSYNSPTSATAQTLQQQQLTQQQLPSSSSTQQQPLPQQQQLSTSSLSPSSAFLPFDKLTRAIVDESILQNFKSSHAHRGSASSISQPQQQQHRPQQHRQQQQQQRQQQQQSQRAAKPATVHVAASSNYNYPKPTAPGKHSRIPQHSY